jgi:hypothetical protein
MTESALENKFHIQFTFFGMEKSERRRGAVEARRSEPYSVVNGKSESKINKINKNIHYACKSCSSKA